MSSPARSWSEPSARPTSLSSAYVERKDMQYLYNDGELYYFMDMETYDQLPINADKLGDDFRFVKENMIVHACVSYKGNVFGVEPPTFVELVSHRYRARLQGRYRDRHHQARYAGDRRSDQGSAVCQHRRCPQGRHENRRIPVQSINQRKVPGFSRHFLFNSVLQSRLWPNEYCILEDTIMTITEKTAYSEGPDGGSHP